VQVLCDWRLVPSRVKFARIIGTRRFIFATKQPRAMPSSVASSTTPAETREPLKIKTVESHHFESSPKRTPTASLWEEFRFKPPVR
jgi:hypothetical protein